MSSFIYVAENCGGPSCTIFALLRSNVVNIQCSSMVDSAHKLAPKDNPELHVVFVGFNACTCAQRGFTRLLRGHGPLQR